MLIQVVGLVYKKGKFSATEEALLAAAIERYRVVCLYGTSGEAIGVNALCVCIAGERFEPHRA